MTTPRFFLSVTLRFCHFLPFTYFLFLRFCHSLPFTYFLFLRFCHSLPFTYFLFLLSYFSVSLFPLYIYLPLRLLLFLLFNSLFYCPFSHTLHFLAF